MVKKRNSSSKKRCVIPYNKKGEHNNVFSNKTFNLKKKNKLFKYYYKQSNAKLYYLQIAARIAYIQYIEDIKNK